MLALTDEYRKVCLDRQMYPDDPGFSRAFTAAELDAGISSLQNGKAPGLDDIETELIKHMGSKTGNRLLRFFNNCTESKNMPKLWRQAKVVALLKPGKDPPEAKSFRPISLLCHTCKLFERLILNRLTAHVDEKLIPGPCWIPPREIIYEPAIQPDGTHQGRLRESPDHRCCLCRLFSCIIMIQLTTDASSAWCWR